MSGLAVYIHIPFCAVKCGYCDFNAYAGLDKLKDAYAAAACDELLAWSEGSTPREITSVFFGGGTPGDMEPGAIAAIIAATRMLGPFADDCEITLEANPATVLEGQLGAFRTAGITRLSLGAQSFIGDELRFLDRLHSPEATGACVRAARRAGFDSVSIDLIYGLPGQRESDWARSLQAAIALNPDHISCYSLTVEEGTVLAARVASGELPAPDPDTAAAMYEFASEGLELAGYEHYEISNWARPGHRSRHNSAYWTEQDYLGIGAGAHGYLGGVRYENVAHPSGYITTIADAGRAVTNAYRPSPSMRAADWLEARLRLLDGFPLVDFATTFGRPLAELIPGSLAFLSEAGVLELTDTHLRLAPRGLLLHSEAIAAFMVELETHLGPSELVPEKGSTLRL